MPAPALIIGGRLAGLTCSVNSVSLSLAAKGAAASKGEYLVNNYDRLIITRATDLFTAQGFNAATVAAKVQELHLCATAGYNTRVEILGLIKLAGN